MIKQTIETKTAVQRCLFVVYLMRGALASGESDSAKLPRSLASMPGVAPQKSCLLPPAWVLRIFIVRSIDPYLARQRCPHRRFAARQSLVPGLPKPPRKDAQVEPPKDDLRHAV